MGAQTCGIGRVDPSSGSIKPEDIESVRDRLNFVKADIHTDHCTGTKLSHEYEYHGSDRYPNGYEHAEMVDVLYEVSPTIVSDTLDVRMLEHRSSGLTRRLLTIRKGKSLAEQHDLRVRVQRAHSICCHGIAKVLEVFEDERAMFLITEDCPGGSIYERILQSRCFAEQEAAVLMRHVIQAVTALHAAGLTHGFLTPESFCFVSDSAHATLKLVDYGLDFVLPIADSVGKPSGPGPGVCRCSRAQVRHWQLSHLVFASPESAETLPDDHVHKSSTCPSAAFPESHWCYLEEEPMNDHPFDWEEVECESSHFADSWGVCAIAFMLLCGYPPFFAPSRQAVLRRIRRASFSFDPPFWSRISEEAKDFVQSGLRPEPRQRIGIKEALHHPWIRYLASTSPSGSMPINFGVNLQRFCRTSRIETYLAHCLSRLSFADAQKVVLRCSEIDLTQGGFVSASNMYHVYIDLHQSHLVDELVAKILQNGETYVDYSSIMQSANLRRDRVLEESLWKSLQTFDMSSPSGDTPWEGRLERWQQKPEVQISMEFGGFDAQDMDNVNSECSSGRKPPVERRFLELMADLTARRANNSLPF